MSDPAALRPGPSSCGGVPGSGSALAGWCVVAMFQSQYSTDTARVFAYTALSMLPALSIFVFAQRYLVGGLVGAIRGLSALQGDMSATAETGTAFPPSSGASSLMPRTTGSLPACSARYPVRGAGGGELEILLKFGIGRFGVEVHIVDRGVSLTGEEDGYPGVRVPEAPDGEGY